MDFVNQTESVQIFTEMGFDEADVIRELARANGNMELTLEYLFMGASPDINEADDDIGADTNDDSDFPQHVFVAPAEPSAHTHSNSTTNPNLTVLNISQYNIGGSSSCTAIACTAVSEMLRRLSRNPPGSIQDKAWMTEVLMRGNAKYQQLSGFTGSVQHMSVEEFFQYSAMLGEGSADTATTVGAGVNVLNKDWPLQGLLNGSAAAFETALDNCMGVLPPAEASTGRPQYVGIVLTKPPETVCVLLPMPTAAGSGGGTAPPPCYLFDSHSRPQLGLHGAYLCRCNSRSELTSRLAALFPTLNLDGDGGGWGGGDMQSMMYNSFDCTVMLAEDGNSSGGATEPGPGTGTGTGTGDVAVTDAGAGAGAGGGGGSGSQTDAATRTATEQVEGSGNPNPNGASQST